VLSIEKKTKSYYCESDDKKSFSSIPIRCENEYKLVEQKPVDKIEPKFKIDDWITNGEYTWNVINIQPLDYILQSQNGDVVDDTISHVDEHFHLWTIQDAKDGDVLYCKKRVIDNNEVILIYSGINTRNNVDSYCRYNSKLGFNTYITNVLDAERDFITPATKEQRDLLFQKMKEAGYEWDAEKKELKKIEKQGEQKPSWSEEDELMLQRCIADFEYLLKTDKEFFMSRYKEQIDWLRFLKGRVQPQPKQEWSEEDEKMLDSIIDCIDGTGLLDFDQIDWLKSLNPQNRWKPGEKQMEALNWVAYNYALMNEGTEKNLQSLYNDLKKL
jgi:hypothetical protein